MVRLENKPVVGNSKSRAPITTLMGLKGLLHYLVWLNRYSQFNLGNHSAGWANFRGEDLVLQKMNEQFCRRLIKQSVILSGPGPSSALNRALMYTVYQLNEVCFANHSSKAFNAKVCHLTFNLAISNLTSLKYNALGDFKFKGLPYLVSPSTANSFSSTKWVHLINNRVNKLRKVKFRSFVKWVSQRFLKNRRRHQLRGANSDDRASAVARRVFRRGLHYTVRKGARIAVPKSIWWHRKSRWHPYWLNSRKRKRQKKYKVLRDTRRFLLKWRRRWSPQTLKQSALTFFKSPSRGLWWKSASKFPRRVYWNRGLKKILRIRAARGKTLLKIWFIKWAICYLKSLTTISKAARSSVCFNYVSIKSLYIVFTGWLATDLYLVSYLRSSVIAWSESARKENYPQVKILTRRRTLKAPRLNRFKLLTS